MYGELSVDGLSVRRALAARLEAKVIEWVLKRWDGLARFLDYRP